MASAPPPAATNTASLVGTAGGATEGLRGLACGVLFGLTSPLVGHPIDTLKTQMQAGVGYQRGGAFATLATLVRNEGVLALYRGILPPLLGSSIFRSVQFSAYGAAMGSLQDSPAARAVIPGTFGLERRVLLCGLFASTARALIETPLEYIKVRQQTGQRWLAAPSAAQALAHPLRELAACYRGFGISWLRTVGLMTAFFVQVDHLERHHHELVATPLLGPFLKGGVCATTGWMIVWPFEVLKNRVQANTEGFGPEVGWVTRARGIVARTGVRGLFRGIGPGVARSLIANGSSMVVYSQCQAMMRG
jgi:solute carrier family 25 carnitine/acylcarnitine transporter 20/29